MTTRPGAPGVPALAFAIAGGGVFAASLIGFGWNLRAGGSLGMDAGPWTSAGWRALGGDLALFSAFALHHSVFARLGLKQALARRLPAGLERSTYVWISSLLFILTWAWWLPVPGRPWAFHGVAALALAVLQGAGVIVTLAAARRLSIFDLSGVAQVLDAHRPRPEAAGAPLVSDGLYGLVRHPIYLGWLLIVWPAPVMTGTRAAFAAISTVYLLVAIPFEERSLRASLGEAYARYRKVVRWRMLPFVY
jgi:methanethiol S-methyltransferase